MSSPNEDILQDLNYIRKVLDQVYDLVSKVSEQGAKIIALDESLKDQRDQFRVLDRRLDAIELTCVSRKDVADKGAKFMAQHETPRSFFEGKLAAMVTEVIVMFSTAMIAVLVNKLL